MVRHGDIEGRLAQLDCEHEQKTKKREPRRRNRGSIEEEDARHVEPPRRHEERDAHEVEHRLVCHRLQRLSRGAHFRVRRARRISSHDEEQRGERHEEHAQKQVSAREEHAARHQGEDEREQDIRVLGGVHGSVFLGEKLAHVVVGLQKRRPDASLHPRGNDAVESREQTADDRTHNRKCDDADDRNDDRHEKPRLPTTSPAA